MGVFIASWVPSIDDSVDVDYSVYFGGGTPDSCVPGVALFTGRPPLVDGRMSVSVTFSETGLPDTVTAVCAHVVAVNRVNGKRGVASNPAQVTGDFTPPPPAPATDFRMGYFQS